jgi:hypothetical protein
MAVANLFARTPLADFGGATYATLEWTPPRTPAGSIAKAAVERLNRKIEEAEAALKSGEFNKTLQLLRTANRPPGSYARRLYLEAAHRSRDWECVLAETDPPRTVDELMFRLDAYSQGKDFVRARKTLEQFSGPLGVPQETQQALNQRLDAEERMRA